MLKSSGGQIIYHHLHLLCSTSCFIWAISHDLTLLCLYCKKTTKVCMKSTWLYCSLTVCINNSHSLAQNAELHVWIIFFPQSVFSHICEAMAASFKDSWQMPSANWSHCRWHNQQKAVRTAEGQAECKIAFNTTQINQLNDNTEPEKF